LVSLAKKEKNRPLQYLIALGERELARTLNLRFAGQIRRTRFGDRSALRNAWSRLGTIAYYGVSSAFPQPSSEQLFRASRFALRSSTRAGSALS
jgi:hypothetical protein